MKRTAIKMPETGDERMVKVGIENFKLPESCDTCPFMMQFYVTYDEQYGCVFTRKYHWNERKRPDDCRLVALDEDEDDLK